MLDLELLEDRVNLTARSAPLGPEVDHTASRTSGPRSRSRHRSRPSCRPRVLRSLAGSSSPSQHQSTDGCSARWCLALHARRLGLGGVRPGVGRVRRRNGAAGVLEVGEVLLRVQGSRAPGAGRGDRLTVVVVDEVAAGEDTLEVGAGRRGGSASTYPSSSRSTCPTSSSDRGSWPIAMNRPDTASSRVSPVTVSGSGRPVTPDVSVHPGDRRRFTPSRASGWPWPGRA